MELKRAEKIINVCIKLFFFHLSIVIILSLLLLGIFDNTKGNMCLHMHVKSYTGQERRGAGQSRG